MRAVKRDAVDVVVGAGLGGAAFSQRLSEKPGLRVVCLERGGWVDRSAMPAWRSDWQRAVLNEWATSPNLRLAAARPSASADYPIDDRQSAFKPLMWNGVGGSTINWAAHFPRLHTSDFGPIYAAEIRRKRHGVCEPGRNGVRINGKIHYLWRAVDHEGEVLEAYVTKRRDRKAALKFLRKAMKRYSRPKTIVTDKLGSYRATLRTIGNAACQETGRWLNNRAENSHQPLRRRERAMQRFRQMATLQNRSRPFIRTQSFQSGAPSPQPQKFQAEPRRRSRRVASSVPHNRSTFFV